MANDTTVATDLLGKRVTVYRRDDQMSPTMGYVRAVFTKQDGTPCLMISGPPRIWDSKAVDRRKGEWDPVKETTKTGGQFLAVIDLYDNVVVVEDS